MDVHLHFLFLSALVYSINPHQAVKHNGGIIGVIVDNTTRMGKEETVAMEMAIEDICNQTNACPALEVTTSPGEAAQAAFVARHLMNDKDVQVILGPRTWEETASVAEVVSRQNIPILSLSDSAPTWAKGRWPFLFQASHGQNRQMRAIAAIVESYQWRRVNVIYEDMDSAINGITPHLYDAFQEVGVQISNLIALSPFADSSVLSEGLRKLKRQQCRVFVIHASLPLGVRLFRNAKEMKMMEPGYVWITTDTITNLVHSLNSSIISTMQGVLGVKGYYHNEGIKYQEFKGRFENKFGSKYYCQEKSHEPGSFAIEAYDAAWTVALAMENGKVDLEKLSRTNYTGLSGEIYFEEGRLAPTEVFQIINVIGRSHRELGFWSNENGFFDAIGKKSINKGYMDIFGQIFWPGGPAYIPKGWEIPTLTNPLKIGVPNNSMNHRFVKVVYEPTSNDYSISGFSIDVFRETVKQLPYFLPFNFFPFNGTYNDLVEAVRLKEFDAAVGDIAIVSQRCKDADFTHPHTESGVVLVVPIRPQANKTWLFLKPFTKAMWFLTISINTYNGFVVWMIERNHYPEVKGSVLSETRTFFLFVFGSLYSLHGERLRSNLSRMATAVWLLVALIISQSYTASLTSMLTVPRLEPIASDIVALRYSNAIIGYSRKSFVRNYLLDVLHFNTNSIRNFSTIEETAEALKSGKIAGAFLEFSTAKLMVAKYCKSFRIAGPIYKIGGYGYVFPKGSPLLSDIDEALMKVFESGVLKQLEDILTASEKCLDSESDNIELLSLSPSTFCVLFVWTVGTSTAALVFYAIHSNCRMDSVVRKALHHWRKKKRIFSRKVSYAEIYKNSDTGESHFAAAA